MTATEKSADVALSDSKEFSNDKPVVSEYGSKKPKREYRFREERLGVWSLYYPITNSWREYLPALESLWVLYDMAKSLPIIWAFVLETLSLGPIFFVAYFISSTLVGFLPAFQLYNNSNTLAFIESTMTGKHVDREQFRQIAISYFAVFSAGLIFHKIEAYSRPILQQRVSLHFKQRLLEVQSRIDLATSENPDVQSKTSRASAWFASPWSILEGLASLLAVIAEVSGQVSMFFRMMDSRQDARLFAFLCVARPLGFFALVKTRHGLYYSMVTDARWLRMQALFDLGTKSSYKKEIIADGLEEFINSQYEKDRKSLGDMSLQAPYEQQSDRSWLTYNDFDGIFDALPLLAFAWINIRTGGKSDLSSLVLIQQATSSLQQTLFGMIYGGNNIANLFKNVMSLYDVLELKPTMVDGEIHYPEEEHKSQKGMAIEFKSVTFKYPMTDKVILKDMSFSISSGQLCVIVGENGCGKSTTINLITRMYDSTSGEVLVDGRPLKEFKLSTYRETTSVMYQDYQHLPLTIHENILLGRPDCPNSKEAVEEAARLGGAFDFVQKLPLKFETNLEPQQTGYVNTWEDDDEEEKNIFQKFIDSQKATKLSGGEWQRLALSKSFMKNSEKVRLLCYDEPSASLDPKAEYETFERLRQLRGGKTMIFVTHRFGHLTKHADLILYVKEGSIVEKGTHKQLLELDGEYAKVYRIQSQAFEDKPASCYFDSGVSNNRIHLNTLDCVSAPHRVVKNDTSLVLHPQDKILIWARVLYGTHCMSLPELPTINPTDQYRVFRHRGADESNEQLSLLGDPILTAVITDWIITNRPTWSPGEVSVVRTALIKGSSVADWTTMYSLDQHIQTSNANSSLLVRRSQGAQVAVFKAYVAAVYLKGGFSTVKKWMADVLSSTVDLEKFDHPPSQLV